ncbi:hypothetical protein D9M72_599740 [compost metagenome]
MLKAGSGFSHSGARAASTSATNPGPKPKVTVSRAGTRANSPSVSARAGFPAERFAASSLRSRSNALTPARVVPGRKSSATNTPWACAAVVIPA